MGIKKDSKIQAIFTLNATPSKLSQLKNDVGFVTEQSVDDKIAKIKAISYRIVEEPEE